MHRPFFFSKGKPAIHHLANMNTNKTNVNDSMMSKLMLQQSYENKLLHAKAQSRRLFLITFCVQSCHISPCGQFLHSHSQGSCRHSLSDPPWPIGTSQPRRNTLIARELEGTLSEAKELVDTLHRMSRFRRTFTSFSRFLLGFSKPSILFLSPAFWLMTFL